MSEVCILFVLVLLKWFEAGLNFGWGKINNMAVGAGSEIAVSRKIAKELNSLLILLFSSFISCHC